MQQFIDKQTVSLTAVSLCTLRLKVLSERLLGYWQAGGADVLPLEPGVAALANRELERCKSLSTGLPDACVLIAISDEPEPQVLLTRRAAYLNSHAGEVSFVGGKRDDTDISSLTVALREAFEEVALPAISTTLLGYLPMQISKTVY